jgi:hypothetical protein
MMVFTSGNVDIRGEVLCLYYMLRGGGTINADQMFDVEVGRSSKDFAAYRTQGPDIMQ